MKTISIILFITTFLLTAFVLNGQNMSKKMKKREVIANYSDSLVKANLFVDNKRIKTKDYLVYYWFKSGKINKNLGGYDGNLLNGRYVVFDENNNMVTEGYFKKGIKHGTWKRWLPKGGILDKQTWKYGQLNGISLLYNKEGTVLQISKYKNGKRHGKYILYENGVETIRKFKNGEEVFPKVKEKKEKKQKEVSTESEKAKEGKGVKEKVKKNKGTKAKETEEQSEDKKVKKEKTSSNSPLEKRCTEPVEVGARGIDNPKNEKNVKEKSKKSEKSSENKKDKKSLKESWKNFWGKIFKKKEKKTE